MAAVVAVPVGSLPALIGTAYRAVAIVPSDTVPLSPCSAIYVGGAGDIVLVPSGNAGASVAAASVTLKAVPVGTVLHVSAQYVMATGTTATDLVALS